MTTSNTKKTEIGEYSDLDLVKARVAEKDKQMERYRKALEEASQMKRKAMPTPDYVEFAYNNSDLVKARVAEKLKVQEGCRKAWEESSQTKPKQIFTYDTLDLVKAQVVMEVDKWSPKTWKAPMPISLKSIPYIPSEETSEKRKEYMKYLRSVQESEGFDIVDYHGDSKLRYHGSSSVRRTKIENVETCKKVDSIVKLAMDEYNHTNKTDFEIIEIKHSNDKFIPGYIGLVYMITFTALKMDEEKIFTFQAQGHGGRNSNFNPEVMFVRLKPLTSHSDDERMCKL